VGAQSFPRELLALIALREPRGYAGFDARGFAPEIDSHSSALVEFIRGCAYGVSMRDSSFASSTGRCLCWAFTAMCLASIALAQQEAVDLDGKTVDPFAASSGKIVVLIFLRRDCPVSSRYAPTIQQISAQYQRKANFWLVYPDKAESGQTVRQYVSDYGYRLPALRDPDHTLVKRAHVQITPEVAVFDRKHNLIYDGRIDDWYVVPGQSRAVPMTHELNDAISAALAGKSAARREVRGVGCYISDLE
jgi:thiol-disulfide isomerase/thioredoxin